MANTYQFALPLVAAAQAQKHVTVNEALARLDVASQLRVVSGAVSAPPGAAMDGQAWLVPAGATGEWASRAEEIAVQTNGIWTYLTPKPGWRLWNEALGGTMMFDGATWVLGADIVDLSGAATISRIVVADQSVAGGSFKRISMIPAGCVVVGVTARVTEAMTGPLTSWQLGVPGSNDRYGSGLGLGLNSYALGATSSPLVYYTDEDIRLTAIGGDFGGGSVRVAVHLQTVVPPRIV